MRVAEQPGDGYHMPTIAKVGQCPHAHSVFIMLAEQPGVVAMPAWSDTLNATPFHPPHGNSQLI
jgi:hypothetical protein